LAQQVQLPEHDTNCELTCTSTAVESSALGVESNFLDIFPRKVAFMETPKAPGTTRTATTIIGKSIAIKGELSCSEELDVDGQVEGVIDPKGNRLTVGPNGRIRVAVSTSAVVVQGKLEGNVQASGGPKAVGRCHG
jgi:hypothetical protein